MSFLPNRNSDAGSHRRLFSPLPSDGSGLVRALHYYREKTSTLAALVDSRRIYTGKCSSTRVEYMLGNVLVYLMLVWLDKIIVACNWQYITGMWITADFRLYPPVITANQELVSPTGDHRYRGGTERAHPRGFRV